MDTEAVKLFVLAADNLNISASGRLLNMAPSVASAKLAKLEKELGAELLLRTTRQVSISIEGAQFLPYAREILSQQDAALAAMGRGKSEVTGTLRFTAPSTFAQLYLTPLLGELQQRHPQLHLDLKLTDMRMPLIEGSFDLALRNIAPRDSSFKGRKLANDKRILCAAPDYLKQYGTPQSHSDLSNHRLIAFQNTSATELIGENGETGEFNPRKSHARLTMDDGLSQKLATMAGAGISLNSMWSIQKELKARQLIRVLPDFTASEKTALWLLYPNTNILTPKVRMLIDYLCENLSVELNQYAAS